MNIPFVDLLAQYQSIKSDIDDAIKSTIRSTAFIGGKPVQNFEDAFSTLYKINHCISVANGTDSLYIIMKMLGIGHGDEVITVANSWISSSETISQTGATPVFVDIDPDYYTIDESQIESVITPRTKAIMPVHLYGQMCDMDLITSIAKKNNLFVIEDCAQSHFSSFKNTLAGHFGDAGSFSFYPGKNLGAYGDAGCIITNDSELANKCKMFARHGALTKHKHVIEGINSRMDGIQAAILSAKLSYILDWTNLRQKNASLYNSYLSNISEIKLPIVRPDSVHSWHLYVIRTDHRDELAKYLNENGIQTAIHYPTALPNLQAYQYLGYKPSDFPVASAYQDQILSLPMYPELNEVQIEYISHQIRAFFSKKQ